jgi:hypothetical protein
MSRPGNGYAVLNNGVLFNMPEEQYFGSDALSASGCKLLLPPSCPALFQHKMSNPVPAKKAFDEGKAAHALVLGTGADVVEIPFDSRRTNAAKAFIAEAYAAGKVPLLPPQMRKVEAMAEELGRHREAAALLTDGTAESSWFWTDPASGVRRKARLDWYRWDGEIVDYKSARAVDLQSVQQAVFKYGYHMQSGSYTDAVEACERALSRTRPYILIWQMNTAPYIVTVTKLDPEVIALGRIRNREAINIYAECVRTRHWPGFSDQIETLTVPDQYEEFQDEWQPDEEDD